MLFRSERAGTPRFPSEIWVVGFADHCRRHNIALAAHLCSSLCEDVVFRGEFGEIRRLFGTFGFRRFQINATKANAVDSDRLVESQCVRHVVELAKEMPHAEFIVQRNEETKALWQGIELMENAPGNISFLFDSSVGTGVVIKDFSIMPKHPEAKFGAAGGINPENVEVVLKKMAESEVYAGKSTWIDMESGIRDPKDDSFSADKAMAVIAKVEKLIQDNVVCIVREAAVAGGEEE